MVTPTGMLHSPVAPTSLLVMLTLAACTADPTSLGEQDSEDGAATAGDTGPSDTATEGSSMDGPGSGDQGGAGADTGPDPTATSTATGSATDPDPGSTSEGTTAGDDTTTSDPGDAAVVLFVNFDGATLTAGLDDATADQASFAGGFDGMPLAPYGDGPKRDAILDRLDVIWSPFDVAITDVRPAAGDYAMIVVTPTNPLGGGVLGIASQDCDDLNPRSVGMAFGGIGDGLSAALMASVISHEVGRGFGLENVDGSGDVMHQFASEMASFTNTCHPLSGMIICGAQHEAHCPAGQQNSFAELSSRFPR